MFVTFLAMSACAALGGLAGQAVMNAYLDRIRYRADRSTSPNEMDRDWFAV